MWAFFLKLRQYKNEGGSPPYCGLYGKVVVGIITNSDDRVPGVLQSLGLKISDRRFNTSEHLPKSPTLEDDVDFVILSYDVGHEKPDSRIFDAATSTLTDMLAHDEDGLTADNFEKLYIGDVLEKDFHGARAAGWHAFLLDRDGNTARKEFKRHIELLSGTKDNDEKKKTVMLVRSLKAISLLPGTFGR